jgi:Uma2 family endonuclease
MNEQLRRPDLSMTTQAAEGLMRRRWSVAEIEEMVKAGILGEDERFELIGGEVVPMSPKGIRHERIKGSLAEYWYRRLPPEVGLIQETTFRLDDDTFVEPGFVFFNAQTLVTHVHRRPGLDGYQDKPEVQPREQLVPDFAPPLAVALDALELI